MDLSQIKAELHQLLKREVGVEQTTKGKWICQYAEYGMSPLALVADTEELAYDKLLQYLKSKVPQTRITINGTAGDNDGTYDVVNRTTGMPD